MIHWLTKETWMACGVDIHIPIRENVAVQTLPPFVDDLIFIFRSHLAMMQEQISDTDYLSSCKCKRALHAGLFRQKSESVSHPFYFVGSTIYVFENNNGKRLFEIGKKKALDNITIEDVEVYVIKANATENESIIYVSSPDPNILILATDKYFAKTIE